MTGPGGHLSLLNLFFSSSASKSSDVRCTHISCGYPLVFIYPQSGIVVRCPVCSLVTFPTNLYFAHAQSQREPASHRARERMFFFFFFFFFFFLQAVPVRTFGSFRHLRQQMCKVYVVTVETCLSVEGA